MNRLFLLCVVSFGVSATLSALSGCGDDCECPALPAQPDPQDGLEITEAATYDEAGEFAPLPVDPTGGTLTITGPEVRIHYEDDRGTHDVTYVVQVSE